MRRRLRTPKPRGWANVIMGESWEIGKLVWGCWEKPKMGRDITGDMFFGKGLIAGSDRWTLFILREHLLVLTR